MPGVHKPTLPRVRPRPADNPPPQGVTSGTTEGAHATIKCSRCGTTTTGPLTFALDAMTHHDTQCPPTTENHPHDKPPTTGRTNTP